MNRQDQEDANAGQGKNAKLSGAMQLKRDQTAIERQGIVAASDEEWEDLEAGAEQSWIEVRDTLTDAIKMTR